MKTSKESFNDFLMFGTDMYGKEIEKSVILDKENDMENIDAEKGGAGSGNHGHAGRPGERGGSASESGGKNIMGPHASIDEAARNEKLMARVESHLSTEGNAVKVTYTQDSFLEGKQAVTSVIHKDSQGVHVSNDKHGQSFTMKNHDTPAPYIMRQAVHNGAMDVKVRLTTVKDENAIRSYANQNVSKGSASSGNHGHAGRPGQRGGSSSEGGRASGGSGITTPDLGSVDVGELSGMEQKELERLTASGKKTQEEALQIIINTTEGDFSQLSPELRSRAEKDTSWSGSGGRDGSMYSPNSSVPKGEVVKDQYGEHHVVSEQRGTSIYVEGKQDSIHVTNLGPVENKKLFESARDSNLPIHKGSAEETPIHQVGEHKGHDVYLARWEDDLGRDRFNAVALKDKPSKMDFNTAYNQAAQERQRGNDPFFTTEHRDAINAVGDLTRSMDSAKLKKAFRDTEELTIIKTDSVKQLVYGVFLWPNKADHDGDIISADDIEKVAHGFLIECRDIDEMHQKSVMNASIVESFIAWEDGMQYYGKSLSKGAWAGAIRVTDLKVWDKIQKGQYKGFSVRISGYREDAGDELI